LNAVVYSFVVEPSQPPVAGAAPWIVLARQVPRLVVQCLNTERGRGNDRGDRGVRYFPFLGVRDNRRGFLEFEERLPIDTLCKVHAQNPPPRFAVDGLLRAGAVDVRILDVDTGRVVAEHTVPFDPRDVWPTVQRLHFELTSLLDWNDPPPQRPAGLTPVAFSWWLVARDELLALEANLVRVDAPRCLDGIREALREAPDASVLHETLVEISRALLLHGQARGEVAELCRATADVARDPGFAETLATVLEAAGDAAGARHLWSELATLRPVSVKAVRRTAAHLYAARAFAEGCSLLRSAVADGDTLEESERIELIAQRIAFEDAAGDERRRDATADELLLIARSRHERGDAPLPPAAARLLAAILTGRSRFAEAEWVAEESARREDGHAGLWLELGRARLGRGDAIGAQDAFRAALEHEPTEAVRSEAERLLTLGRDEECLARIQRIDGLLADGLPKDALVEARKLRRARPKMPEAWLFLGLSRQKCGKHAAARRAYREALRLDPDCGEAHNRLGALLAVAGKDEEAYRHLTRAADLLPDEWSPRLHLAQVAWHLGRRDEALSEFTSADSLGAPSDRLVEAMRLCGADPGALGRSGE
jgi:tetratricopeptide (TPR) repeat protein